MKETKLGLLIPEDGDAPDGPNQIGDNAERGDLLHLAGGGNGKHLYVAAEKTRTSAVTGSFSTALKLTLPEVKNEQLLQIIYAGYAKCSVKTFSSLEGGQLAVVINGTVVDEKPIIVTGTSELAAEQWVLFTSGKQKTYSEIAGGGPSSMLKKKGLGLGTNSTSPLEPFAYVLDADATEFTIELQGRSVGGGTITVSNVYIGAATIF